MGVVSVGRGRTILWLPLLLSVGWGAFVSDQGQTQGCGRRQHSTGEVCTVRGWLLCWARGYKGPGGHRKATATGMDNVKPRRTKIHRWRSFWKKASRPMSFACFPSFPIVGGLGAISLSLISLCIVSFSLCIISVHVDLYTTSLASLPLPDLSSLPSFGFLPTQVSNPPPCSPPPRRPPSSPESVAMDAGVRLQAPTGDPMLRTVMCEPHGAPASAPSSHSHSPSARWR